MACTKHYWDRRGEERLILEAFAEEMKFYIDLYIGIHQPDKREGYQFLRTLNIPQTEWLKEQKLIFSQFWMIEARDQVCPRGHAFPEGPRTDPPRLLSPCAGVPWLAVSVTLVCTRRPPRTSASASLNACLSLHPTFPFL